MYQNLRLLQDIVDYAQLPIAVYSGNNLLIEFANTAMIQAWGKGNEVIGKTFLEILPEVQKQKIFDQVLSVYKTGIPFHAKDKKVDLLKNGTLQTYYFNYSFIPLFDEREKIYGVMNTATDVTDLHLANHNLQSAVERLKIAVESSGIGTYEIDLSSKKIKTYGNFNSICSIDPNSDITNEKLIAKLHPDDLAVREKAHQQAQITGIISYEARIKNEDQSIKWTKINGKIIKDENNLPITIIGTIQDISEQKQFEDELKRKVDLRTEELLRSNDDLMHFANVVSHDLREPVRKIKIFNNLLKNDKETAYTEKFKKYINKIEVSAIRMENIIEGVLAYSTIDKTTQPVEKIDLNETINNIKIDLELIIHDKGAILVTCDLPEIEGAPVLINQLFYNLIQNALKFSKKNEPPRVIISCSTENKNGQDYVQISIKDHGIGLESAFFEKIFAAFERLHTKDQYEGNGLGLALCRKIAERHMGTITATGEKDNGAVFTVILPVKQKTNTI